MPIRVRASLLHLSISAFLVSSVFAFVLLLCYPGPYSEAMGVRPLLVVLAGVDICLGPLITLIIYNPAKPHLKYELAFIGIVQLSAMLYGAMTVFVARPVYLVFDKDQLFTLALANQIPAEEIKRMHSSSLSITGPELVGARAPVAKAELKKFMQEELEEHVDLARMPQYYIPYETITDDVKAKMSPTEKLLVKRTPERAAEITTLLNQVATDSGSRLDELGFIAMQVPSGNRAVILRRKDASIVKILPVDPFD